MQCNAPAAAQDSPGTNSPPDSRPEDCPVPLHLVDRRPEMSGQEMAAELVPPRQFAHASFDNYVPDPAYPSQAEAEAVLQEFASGGAQVRSGWGRKKAAPRKPGVYLDGGFGVGKTHLLAALWHATGGSKHFGTFIEYTALIGALGYQQAVALLAPSRLICIDEFELDDPGDTMMMTRLIADLTAGGTRFAATSNTPPNALGEGRFAAADFMREIRAMADRFDVLRIEGEDYRRRESDARAIVATDAEAEAASLAPAASLDSFDALLAHLATVHPSRYVRLIDGVECIVLTGVHPLADQTAALRLVAFIDRVYDAQVPVVATGTPLDEVFGAEMLAGGYRKKYLRAMSRIVALTDSGAGVHA